MGKASFFSHQVSHYDSRYTEEITSDLEKLTMPVKLLWGAEDEWQPLSYARRLAEEIPSADLTTVEEAGHFLTEDAPGRVTAQLTAFLDGA